METKSEYRCTTCGGSGVICRHDDYHGVVYQPCRACNGTGFGDRGLTNRDSSVVFDVVHAECLWGDHRFPCYMCSLTFQKLVREHPEWRRVVPIDAATHVP